MNHPDGRPPGDRLACGRELDHLYDLLSDDIPDDHAHSCPYCHDAAAAFEPVRRVTTLLLAEPAEPPPGFVDTVMTRIRAETRHGTLIPLPAEPPARLAVHSRAAAAVLAIAASTVPGMAITGCRFPDPTDHTHILITVGIRYGIPVRSATDQVRQAVLHAAWTQLGITLRIIDINIDDIQPPP